TRQEMVVMLVRMINPGSIESSPNLLNTFADGDRVSPWARDAYRLAVQAGLVIPQKGNITPTKTATRGEAAYMLARSMDLANRS
ncbi:MAG TPA: hypothetical protein VHS59_10055, partial [Bacillota bacterium]|nr:hypothetical protein [Bacillota bacterium]